MNGKTYPVYYDIALKAIIIRCLDRRFRVAHSRFIREELGLKAGNIVPIKRAGGVGPLSKKKTGWNKIPKDVRRQVELFLEKHPEIETIVLINHEDCRRFDKLRNDDVEMSHLIEAIEIFRDKFPEKKTRGFFARFADPENKKITFDEVKPL